MQLLYQYSITDEMELPDVEDGLFKTENLDARDLAYVKKIMAGFPEKRCEIDELVSRYSSGWKIERIGKVDLAILRLAIYEMRYLDVPPKAAINEAVEIAKKYGAEKSYQYINGLLGGYLKAVKEGTAPVEPAKTK